MNERDPSPWPAVKIVLIGTSHPGNIGATARAMQTMCLDGLHLVMPECDPYAGEARAMAAGADQVMAALQVHDTLESAIGDCQLILGCTARRRTVALPEISPRVAAADLIAAASARPVALLFGRERTGLENHELQQCHAAVHIPTNPEYGSLNLAAAVQVMAYELRLAAMGDAFPRSASQPADVEEARIVPAAHRRGIATHTEMEHFFGHLEQALVDIDFHKGRESRILMQRLRRLFLRAEPDSRELRILRGILGESQRMARIARQAMGEPADDA